MYFKIFLHYFPQLKRNIHWLTIILFRLTFEKSLFCTKKWGAVDRNTSSSSDIEKVFWSWVPFVFNKSRIIFAWTGVRWRVWVICHLSDVVTRNLSSPNYPYRPRGCTAGPFLFPKLLICHPCFQILFFCFVLVLAFRVSVFKIVQMRWEIMQSVLRSLIQKFTRRKWEVEWKY